MIDRIRRIPKLAVAGIALVMVAALVVASVAAFGGGSGAAASGGPPDPAALEQFSQCLSDHGVQMPQPGERPQSGQGPQPGQAPGAGAQAPSQKMEQALQACRQYLPRGAFVDPPGGLGGAPPSS